MAVRPRIPRLETLASEILADKHSIVTVAKEQAVVVQHNTSVLQEWVAGLGLRHQGVLMSCIRGCDNVPKEDATKLLARCLRAVVLRSFDEKPTSFIEHVGFDELRLRMVAVLKNHDHYPVHYLLHLMHGAEIIGCQPRSADCRYAQLDHAMVPYLKSPGGQEFARKHMPLLDDWVNGQPDAWDYEAVLHDNGVTVAWGDTVVDGEGNLMPAGEFAGWDLCWKHGVIYIGRTTEVIARKAAALFVSLWLRGISASFCDKLMDGYICFLERQENTSLTFLAEFDRRHGGGSYLRVTREGFCQPTCLDFVEKKIVAALGGSQPDEEIIVTFTKRKKI